MTPPKDGLDVATHALHADAREWARWAESLVTAARVADGLILTADDLCVLSETIGLPELYSAVQHRAAALAADGANTFITVAEALSLAAKHYDQADRNAVRRLTPR